MIETHGILGWIIIGLVAGAIIASVSGSGRCSRTSIVRLRPSPLRSRSPGALARVPRAAARKPRGACVPGDVAVCTGAPEPLVRTKTFGPSGFALKALSFGGLVLGASNAVQPDVHRRAGGGAHSAPDLD